MSTDANGDLVIAPYAGHGTFVAGSPALHGPEGIGLR